VTGAKGFRDLNLHHGDIQPSTVFVMSDKSLKLADVCFINGENSGFERKYHDIEYTTPLGPQAMSGLMLGPTSVSFDKEKNDVWAIGEDFFYSLKKFLREILFSIEIFLFFVGGLKLFFFCIGKIFFFWAKLIF